MGEYVNVGERIQSARDGTAIGGHGTIYSGSNLISSVSGFVERVNKLVVVRQVRARYMGEIGDVVVGRITSVDDKRWKVDVSSSKDATLQLSSVNLPGIQRRKTQTDELQMRQFYKENDLISAEVQKVHHQDGSIMLQTRSSKYGKLKYGSLVQVNQTLVKRCPQHFITLDSGVFLILGNNGYIWVSLKELQAKPRDQFSKVSEEEWDDSESRRLEEAYLQITVEDREKIARARNSIVALDQMFYGIWPETIQAVYLESLELGLKASQILHSENLTRVTNSVLNL